MTSSLDKLNLRPGERRLVVLAGLALFVVLNLIFVVPRFGEWGRSEQQIRDSQARLDKFAVEVNKQSYYKKELERLRLIGQSIPPEDQSLDMSVTVTSQAALSGVSVQSISADRRVASTSKTNLFFDEKTASLALNSTEQQLVDFLYLLGNGNSLIRARSLTVIPDPSKMRLAATMTLVASYQRKAPARATTAAKAVAGTNAPAVKPGPAGPATATPAPPVASPFKAPPVIPKTNRPSFKPVAATNSPAGPKPK